MNTHRFIIYCTVIISWKFKKRIKNVRLYNNDWLKTNQLFFLMTGDMYLRTQIPGACGIRTTLKGWSVPTKKPPPHATKGWPQHWGNNIWARDSRPHLEACNLLLEKNPDNKIDKSRLSSPRSMVGHRVRNSVSCHYVLTYIFYLKHLILKLKIQHNNPVQSLQWWIQPNENTWQLMKSLRSQRLEWVKKSIC